MSFSTLFRRVAGPLALLVLVLAGTLPGAVHAQSVAIRGDEPSYLDFGLGVFNEIQSHHRPTVGDGRIEFRSGEKLIGIGPAVGLLANTRGGVLGYGGVYTDIAVFDRFVVTPLAGIGGYSRGGSENLGGTFEFRLSLEAAYELDDRSRLGVQAGHISNAGTHSRNPGENDVMAIYAIPLGSLF